MLSEMASHPTQPRPSAHHAYRSWTCSWYDDQRHRRTKRLGRVDEVSRKEAQARYKNWLRNEWESKHHVRNPDDPAGFTVEKLANAYFAHATETYRKHGRVTSHVDSVKAALDALSDRYGSRPADGIGAPEITLLRDSMIVGEDRHGRLRARSIITVNGRLRIIKQAFKWARSYGHVSKETAFDISLAPPLRIGRSKAKPPLKVLPVPDDVLVATLAVATPTIADMINVQLLTGMRPGELCSMRACDIERNGSVWVYRPTSHKTEHHDKDRVIPIGPQAQQIIAGYIGRRMKLSEFVFLPEDTHRERLEQIGYPKVMAYQVSRSTFKPGRCFQTQTYYGQICRTCDRAFDPKGEKRAAGDYSHRWHPHQLRHNAATRIRDRFGIEAAKDILGQSNISTALIYAERSLEKMKQIAAAAG